MKLICCEDIGLIEEELKPIKEKKFLLQFLENENYDKVISKVGQSNLFDFTEQDKKTYIFYDYSKRLATKLDDKLEKFFEFLISTNEDIVFYSQIKEEHKSISKFFDKNITHIKKLNKLTIQNFIRKKLIENNMPLTYDIVVCLAEKLPLDSLIISNEIKKLSYLDSKDLNAKTINKILIDDIEKNIFNLVNDFFNDNYEKVMKQINYLDEIKVPFVEVFNILVMQLFNLKLYCSHYEKFKSIDKILKDFGLQRFQIEKLIKTITTVKVSWINNFLNNLLKLDLNFKNGKSNLDFELKMLLMNRGEYGL